MVDVGALAGGLQAGVGETAQRATAVPPLWALIIIVVVGTGLVALAIGLCCLCACRRRRGGDSGKLVVLHGMSERASDGGSSHDEAGGKRARGRLRKRRPSTLAGYYGVGGEGGDGDEGDGEIGFREISPVRKVSALAMPGFLGRRGSLNPFAGHWGGGGGYISNNAKRGSGAGGHHGLPRRMSNAWVDEDTLHGPRMTSDADQPATAGGGGGKATVKSWRRSLRESWPLKTLSPTLPRVPTFEGIEEQSEGGGAHDSVSMFNYKDYHGHVPELLPPPPPPPPPRPLPKPPRQALLVADRASVVASRAGGWAGARSVGEVVASYRGLSYYKYEDTDEPVRSTNSLRTKPGGGVELDTDATRPRVGRLSSTGSTLSVILKGTEMRLQEGTATGSARRSRLSTSPPKNTAAGAAAASAAAVAAGPDGSTATLVGSAPRTPSPPKPPRPLSGSAGVASAHNRQTSDASVLSEADSMVGDGSPGLLYHGLTSPSRSKPQQQQLSPHKRKLSRAASFTSSVASSLSDISEENSMASGMTPNTTAPGSSIPADMTKIAGLASDPFVATGDTAPAGNGAGPRSRGVYPASRGAHGALDRQRSRQTSGETLFTIAQSPLSLISGNSRSPEPSPTRVPERAIRTRSPQPQRDHHPAAVHLPAPASWDSPSDDIHKRSSPGRSTPTRMAIPNLSLTSPSADGDSPTPRRPGGAPRRLDSPPDLVHGLQLRGREESPDMAPPSPALASSTRLSSVYDLYAQMDPGPSSVTPAAGSRRRAAGEVRKMSGDTTASSSCYSDQDQDQGAYEREKMEALDELNALLSQDIRAGQPAATATATVRMVPPEQGGSSRNLEVSSTVAELRRMNSQVSAAASGYSDDSTATARPEVVSPPRKGAAARNYLAVGSPPKGTGRRGPRDQENDGRQGPKRLRMDVDDGGMARPGVALGTPVRNRRHERVQGQGTAGERNRSEESLGLYDEDGFLISPERRLVLRT